MIAAELQIAIGAPVGGHSCVMPRRQPRCGHRIACLGPLEQDA